MIVRLIEKLRDRGTNGWYLILIKDSKEVHLPNCSFFSSSQIIPAQNIGRLQSEASTDVQNSAMEVVNSNVPSVDEKP